MQQKHLYEYAVIRAVPRVDREEFFNIGVILYCRTLRFLDLRLHLDVQKLACLAPECSPCFIEDILKGIEGVCKAKKEAGPIAGLPAPERFRWLTAKRSTIVQMSAVHIGLSEDPAETLDRIFRKSVL